MLACQNGHEETTRLLIDRKANVHQAPQSGMTALMPAAQNGRESIIEMLIAEGADPLVKRDDGSNALMLAEEFGRLGAARRLRAEMRGEKRLDDDPNDPFRYPDPKPQRRAKAGRASSPKGQRRTGSKLSSATKVLARLEGQQQ